jgi:hypothetical protein
MCRSLPSGTTLHDIRKEARDLLDALLRREDTALNRYRSFDPFAGRFEARLDEAQYIIAREYGYRSWRRLAERVKGAGKATTMRAH